MVLTIRVVMMMTITVALFGCGNSSDDGGKGDPGLDGTWSGTCETTPSQQRTFVFAAGKVTVTDLRFVGQTCDEASIATRFVL
jgi:uncharacterized lipoprotein NlpE involved in copper resistance